MFFFHLSPGKVHERDVDSDLLSLVVVDLRSY